MGEAGYGFAKGNVVTGHEEFKKAFDAGDVGKLREWFKKHPEGKALINAPIGPFDSPAVVNAKSREMLDLFLELGADINAKSKWWAGGFCLLDSASDELAAYAIERGARVEANAAARLGMMDRLRELYANDHGIVHARGGDGQTPLHVARNVEVAEFLVERGADINARDVDHESTPAQYAIGERAEVARFLAGRGCETDVFLAAALGDLDLVKKHLAADANCLNALVNEKFFPSRNTRAGGTIYYWTLGRNISPQRVAKKFGHEDVFRFLMEQSSAEIQLVNWGWLGGLSEAKKLLHDDPAKLERLAASNARALADAARDNDLRAVETMLEIG